MTPSAELPGPDWAEWLADLVSREDAPDDEICHEIKERPEVKEALRKMGPKPE